MEVRHALYKITELPTCAVQVADDAEGPATKREYQLAKVPVGAALKGQAVNFLGCVQGSQLQLGADSQLPLLNEQLDMKSREQINTPLFTGVKVICCKLLLSSVMASAPDRAFCIISVCTQTGPHYVGMLSLAWLLLL